MTLDPILKEEICRSVVVYFLSFLAIGVIIDAADLPISLGLAFPLALIPTALHCGVMVWYRRKEHIVDPSPAAVLGHALRVQKSPRPDAGHLADAILAVVIYLMYLVIARTYPAIPFLWIIVLLVVSIILGRLIFTENGHHLATPARVAAFYLALSTLLIVRDFVLGYPIVPHLTVLAIVGGGTAAILLVWTLKIKKTIHRYPRKNCGGRQRPGDV